MDAVVDHDRYVVDTGRCFPYFARHGYCSICLPVCVYNHKEWARDFEGHETGLFPRSSSRIRRRRSTCPRTTGTSTTSWPADRRGPPWAPAPTVAFTSCVLHGRVARGPAAQGLCPHSPLSARFVHTVLHCLAAAGWFTSQMISMGVSPVLMFILHFQAYVPTGQSVGST
jgi:hypothetical protein